MKKILMFIVALLMLSGCKNKYITCKIDLENEELGYTLNASYKIYYKRSYVVEIEKQEEYTSTNRDTLKYLEQSKSIELNDLNEKYSGYTFDVDNNKKRVKIYTKIDLNEVDLKSMIKDKYLDKYYVDNNRLTLGGVKLFYESKSATCEGGKS